MLNKPDLEVYGGKTSPQFDGILSQSGVLTYMTLGEFGPPCSCGDKGMDRHQGPGESPKSGSAPEQRTVHCGCANLSHTVTRAPIYRVPAIVLL